MKLDFPEQTTGEEPNTLETYFLMQNANDVFYKDKIPTFRLLKGIKKEQKYILICSGHTNRLLTFSLNPGSFVEIWVESRPTNIKNQTLLKLPTLLSAEGESGNDLGKLLHERRESPEDEKVMSIDKTELNYLGIQIGIKGGIMIQNNAVRRKYF